MFDTEFLTKMLWSWVLDRAISKFYYYSFFLFILFTRGTVALLLLDCFPDINQLENTISLMESVTQSYEINIERKKNNNQELNNQRR